MLCALLSLSAGTTAAEADDRLLHQFASCTGRLSALMEHQWLMGHADADKTQAWRNTMASLLDAIQPQGAGRMVLSLRIEAKMAQASLLQRAVFNDDPADAARAQQQSEVAIATCASLIIT